jgi:hypothetical protein
MTTSVFTPVVTTTYKAWLRLAVVLAIVVFSVTLFAIGRATVHVHRASPAITPAAAVVPSAAGAAVDGGCLSGQPRC